ncbi:hypothetical protein [Nitratiruptor sp. SB155-2]|uniref:hypothetical protein n=1 Tax=Nitratiruptor sp. (strain SB155-2) TaxID=387092 RepID=UPI0001586F71|nr:hypothetical protein [Nitratiruptor sp. SB155-2]BAF69594.1 hypothetical protein NIS_0480 [Nitratiruptor sp. SB155-2]BAN05356.1 55 kDa structural protein [Nitratiruptor phage NrS-1]
MSIELAAISGLKKELGEKVGLVREFDLVAGEDITKGQKVTVGEDGKAYTKLSLAGFNTLEEVLGSFNDNESHPTLYTAGYSQIDDTRALFLFNRYSTNANVSNEWQLALTLAYQDANGALQTTRSFVIQVDGYTGGSTWTYNTIQSPILHKIDDTHYLISWARTYYHYDGSAYIIASYLESCIATLDLTNNTFSIGTVTSSATNSTSGGYTGYVSYAFKFLPVDAGNVFYLEAITQDIWKISVNTTDYSITHSSVNTASAFSDLYGSVIPISTGGSFVVEYANNTSYYKNVITSNTATDVTRVQITSGEVASNVDYIWTLDVQKAIVKNNDGLYINEYNSDATIASQSKLECDFDDDVVYIASFSQDILSYKDADGNYLVAFPTYEVGKAYADPLSNNVHTAYNVIVARVYYDSTTSKWYAEKIGEIEGFVANIGVRPIVAKLGDYFVIASGTWKAYDSFNEVEQRFTYSTDPIQKHPAKLYARADALAGDTVSCFTPEVPISLGLNVGEKLGQFIGVGNGYAIKEDR